MLNKIKKILEGGFVGLKDILVWVSHSKYRLNCPVHPRHDDVFFVSFPKSGATWMNFLVAGVNLSMSDDMRKPTFFNIHQLIPDLHDCRDIGMPSLPFPGFRMIKSHSPINPYYRQVVYVVRDPRDVMLSYYYFMRGLSAFDGTVSEFIRSKIYGIESWVGHVEGWFEQSSPSVAFLTVKYEDLKLSPETELSRVYSFLGYDLPENIVAKAVEQASFENMKKAEQKLNYGGRTIAKAFQFMRKGKASQGVVELGATDLQFINDKAGHLMEALGYS